MTNPSTWQENIEGTWHGRPSVFDAVGTCVGSIKVDRSSVFENGQTTYYMDTDLDVRGPLRARFEARDFAFGVRDSDADRIYLGPDFVGAGHPHGSFVDAHYYSPAWTADLNTMVQILDDGSTQVYSSLLYDGPSLVGVFNGVYRKASGYGDDADVTTSIDAFLAEEKLAGPRPHVLPFKHAGAWTGSVHVYDAQQNPAGSANVAIRYRPLTLLRAAVDLEVEGDIELRATYERSRNGLRHVYEGPDIYGNAIAFGRALYTSQHFYDKALKIRGREFLIDDDFTMGVVWQVFGSGRRMHTLFGALTWRPTEQVLSASHGRAQS
jgi:hypothetical protein